MNDLENLLSRAGRPDGPADPALVDADVARGRRALSHRRMRNTAGRSLVVGALAIGGFAVVHGTGNHTAGTSAAPTHATAPAHVASSIKLVAWTGAQPDGYTVDSVPNGWEIQGVNDYNLDIAPIGYADKDLSDFVGKLVVMLQSKDAKPLTAADGDTVAVGSGTGIVSSYDREDGLQLNYQDAATGKWVMIQAPLSLHWTDAQLGAFAAAVHVSATAEAGVG